MPKKLIDSTATKALELQSEQDSSSASVIRRIKHQPNSTQSDLNIKKRFSCDELEILKERFVDFIKLDQPTATLDSPPHKQVVVIRETEATISTLNSSSSVVLSTSTTTNNLLNKHLLIDNQTNKMDTFEHLPLPDPPPQFLLPTDQDVNKTNPMQIRSYLSSRLSVVSSESSSGAEYSLSSSSSSSSSSRPEPPQRTVSIRNSSVSMMMDNLSINGESNYSRPIRLNTPNKEDCLSIKSNSIYSSYRGFQSQPQSNTIVRSSRSVFSIYEEEDENSASCAASSSLSTTSSSSSSSTSPYSNLTTMTQHIKLERLTDFDVKKIESMYRSIGSIVHVSNCTCDLYTTTSEQVANLLNDCWNLEQNSIVPVWLFDTGLNPKRPKQLRLLFVDKSTAFPFQSLNSTESVITKPVLINRLNRIKNPNSNEKRLTFTLNNKQLICLIQFYDLFTCKEFFKFYSDLETNPRHFNLFNETILYEDLLEEKNSSSQNRFKSMSFRKQIKKNQSQSMLSLSKNTSDTLNRNNRYSDLVDKSNKNNCNNSKFYKLNAGSLTTGNINQHLYQLNENEIRITGITKNCISNPCAFQHISTLKNDDQRIRFLIENNKRNF